MGLKDIGIKERDITGQEKVTPGKAFRTNRGTVKKVIMRSPMTGKSWREQKEKSLGEDERRGLEDSCVPAIVGKRSQLRKKEWGDPGTIDKEATISIIDILQSYNQS